MPGPYISYRGNDALPVYTILEEALWAVVVTYIHFGVWWCDDVWVGGWGAIMMGCGV